MVEIRHCVVPAAGLGTRFLPATKALPKELLPVVDRPVIQWGVEEAVAAGASEIIFVISRGKQQLAEHFTRNAELEAVLERRGKVAELEAIRRPERMARFTTVYQDEPLGLGHAVLAAEPAVGDHPFFCLLPDDLSDGDPPILAQLAAAYGETATPIIALARVHGDDISRYGCATIAESRGALHRVTAMVEKPAPSEAASDLAIMGRYVLPGVIFPAIRQTRPGAGGEIQLTDAIARLLESGEVWGVEFSGELLDVGTPEGWLATNVRLAGERDLAMKLAAAQA